MTTRRGFLGAILAAATAPAIIKAEALMPVRKIIAPPDPVNELRKKIGQTTVVGARGLKTGDVFTMAGVLGASGFHRQFVVTSVSDGGVLTVEAG